MKILFVIDSFYTTNNGTSISAQRFAGELRRRGHEVKALCWDSPTDSSAESLTDGDFRTAKFHMPVFQPLMNKHDFSFAYNDTAIVHAACDWADIVHIFVPFGISMEAVKYCNRVGKPVTAAFHIQPENMTSSVSMGKVRWFNELFYRSFRKNVYNRVRHVHVPSRFMGDMIAERGYTAKIYPISNGIQEAFMEAGERKAMGECVRTKGKDSPIKIMMIGRLSQEKRQDVIINAVKYSKYADRIQLVFAGRGPEYDKYVELGKDLKHQPQFVYVGRNELIEHLLETDLYVHASDMESEAISCIEAFATGLVPIIANSPVSATPQFALDGRSLFMPGDPKDLARAIDYWLDHPEEKTRMEEQYRQFGRQYSLASSVAKFEQMLNTEMQEQLNVDSQLLTPVVKPRSRSLLRRVAALWSMLTFVSLSLFAQEKIEYMPYGKMDSWTVRYIKESALLGGKTRALYVVAKTDTIRQNKPYPYGKNGSPWGTSNAYAKVCGVEKAAVSATPERRGNGYCCRLETTLHTVKAIGIDLKALATGSLFTGRLIDPATLEGAKNPMKAIDMGIPFTKRPVALTLDYKALIQQGKDMVHATGGTKVTTVKGQDAGEILLFLQYRWEDADGNIFAYRVGTASEHITRSVPNWQNNHRLSIRYGDIIGSSEYKSWEKISKNRFMARNSKGKMVPIQEVGYRSDVTPTHLILQISSSCQEPYTGCTGNVVWVDNIRLVY